MTNAEECKYYSLEASRKNGKACLKDPDHPCRCMPWLYNYNCKDYVNESNENIKR